ncbi:MAG: protein translocase subunit SecF, partial [Actinobacteria bacterium]|nr:protein translocase subunit SecF [Actinomycetota bacterium]
LAHDLVITVGIYALAGFEVTPASVIGFLTILGYSLYDTVVVFDKVRENTREAEGNGRLSYSQAANQAVNQTLVRSINTSVVALLPVASILVIGSRLLGPGTLLDLSLALFVGIAVGTYSSIFIATPVLADLREREPAIQKLKKRAMRYQSTKSRQVSTVPSVGDPLAQAGTDIQDTAHVSGGRALHPYVQTGPRNQPKRPPKSKR